jgi:hypothetical protein
MPVNAVSWKRRYGDENDQGPKAELLRWRVFRAARRHTPWKAAHRGRVAQWIKPTLHTTLANGPTHWGVRTVAQ